MSFCALGAAYGTAKSGTGIAAMSVMRPQLIMKSIIPVVMAGIIAIYGLVVAVLITNGLKPTGYTLFKSFVDLGAGLSVGLSGLAAGFAIGIVGDSGVRGTAQQPELFVTQASPLSVQHDDDDDEQYDNKPINLSKVVSPKRDDQVDSSRPLQASQDTRHQMNEVGSSVSAPQSSYNASSGPHLNNQAEPLKKWRSHPDPVSSHILDTSVGLPAKGVLVSMYRMGGEQVWNKLQSRVTNDDGRASNFLSWEEFQPGTYKMHFSTGQYFKDRATETFYPYAEVVFEIKNPEAHYHIPLLLNPYGYSTYRGS